MLEIFGRGYVMQHCMEHMRRKMDERRYRAYITDALMAISENTARFNGGSGMVGRWIDYYRPEQTRTTEEIITDVIAKAGLT